MKISRRTCRNIFLLSSLLILPIIGFTQTIDIASGMNEVKGHVKTIQTGIAEIVLYVLGISATIGLCKRVYEMFTDEHGGSWKAAVGWLAIFLFSAVCLYLLKTFVQ